MNSRVFALLLLAAVGVFAEEYNCNAESRVCQNGGVCHDTLALTSTNPGSGGNGWATPQCICKSPYGGLDCSWTIRECKDSPCLNGGTCRAANCRPGTNMANFDCFTCECPMGWSGSPPYTALGGDRLGGVCDWPQLQDCRLPGQQCYNGGICKKDVPAAIVSTWSCDCTNEWMGTNCTVANFNCTTLNPCLNGGSCITNGAACSCVNGGAFTGDNCEISFCSSNPCLNGGTCNPSQYPSVPGSCSCTSEFTGAFCQAPRFCASNPCQNGASCTNSAQPSLTGSCSNLCPAGFSGTYCEIPPFCNLNLCQNGATCNNGTQTCACPVGFAGSYCEVTLVGCGAANVDCAVAHTTTYNSAVANNMQKTCPCQSQSTCASSNFDTSCACANGPNVFAFDCRCNSTYTPRCPQPLPSGGGNAPGANVDMVCANGGSCVEWAEGSGCSCRPGFWGTSCENYDNPCLNNPCKNQGQCFMVQETGMRWNPKTASGETQGALARDDRFWGYRCRCKWPYYGENCELVASRDPVVCTNNNCQNGGTCGPQSYSSTAGNMYYIAGNFRTIATTYVCTCTANFTGVFCESPKTLCESSIGYCLNGGKCVNGRGAADGNKPGCICPCGYAGDRCEISAANADATSLLTLSGTNGGVGYRLDFCSREPCQNGGTCVTAVNGQNFWCQCKSGYGNRYCETKVRSAAAGVVPSLVAVAAAVAVAFGLKH